MKKLLPIGIQTFQKIRKDNYLYVDKTGYIYKLIKQGDVYFLSRPRRFGKSLLISTLEAIFKGKKELFKGLYIYDQEYDWQKYPVIRIDFSIINKDDPCSLEKSLRNHLETISKKYELNIDKKQLLTDYFKSLIKELSQINKVVVLIDEYDAPIIKHLAKDIKKAKEISEVLKDFYTIIKGMDECIRFVFLTGVSKFSKVGVFSGLNNLKDLTMDGKYSDLVGWTQEELEGNFIEYIKELADKEGKSKQETVDDIKYWYNGYRFSEKELYVYNPFSTLLLFSEQTFKYHWFQTGTPTFLINLIKSRKYYIQDIEEIEVKESSFSTYEVESLDVLPLLFQTGYITIKDYDPKFRIYKLGYPNYEVKQAFLECLIESELEKKVSAAYIYKLIRSIERDDLEEFFEVLKVFFANVPYDIQLKNEKYYQTIFYLIFTLIGLEIDAEVRTNRGRIDAVIQSENSVYVFEFKLYSGKEKALNQIKEKKYYQKFTRLNKKIYIIGVEFDQKERNIGSYIKEEISCE